MLSKVTAEQTDRRTLDETASRSVDGILYVSNRHFIASTEKRASGKVFQFRRNATLSGLKHAISQCQCQARLAMDLADCKLFAATVSGSLCGDATRCLAMSTTDFDCSVWHTVAQVRDAGRLDGCHEKTRVTQW